MYHPRPGEAEAFYSLRRYTMLNARRFGHAPPRNTHLPSLIHLYTEGKVGDHLIVDGSFILRKSPTRAGRQAPTCSTRPKHALFASKGTKQCSSFSENLRHPQARHEAANYQVVSALRDIKHLFMVLTVLFSMPQVFGSPQRLSCCACSVMRFFAILDFLLEPSETAIK